MGKGQLAGIPNWIKNKLKELTSRVSKNETDISTINSDLIKIGAGIPLINHTIQSGEVQTNIVYDISSTGYKVSDFREFELSLMDNNNKIIINPMRITRETLLSGYWLDHYFTAGNINVRTRMKYHDETHLTIWCNGVSQVVGVGGIL